jgi:hypothetical protein
VHIDKNGGGPKEETGGVGESLPGIHFFFKKSYIFFSFVFWDAFFFLVYFAGVLNFWYLIRLLIVFVLLFFFLHCEGEEPLLLVELCW